MDGVILQLCQWLSQIIRCNESSQILTSSLCTSMNTKIRGIYSLLTANLPLLHIENSSTSRPTEKLSNCSSEAQLLGLSSLLAFLELILASFPFCFLLHVSITKCQGGKTDPFLIPLLSFWESLNNQSPHQQNVSTPDPATEFRSASRLKHLSSEWRRLSKDWRHRSPSYAQNGTEKRWNQKVNRSDTPASDDTEGRESDGRESEEREHDRWNSARRMSNPGVAKSKNLRRSFSCGDERTSLERSSIEGMKSSIFVLLKSLLNSLLPIILWTYLSRSIFPFHKSNWNSRSNTNDQDDQSNHDGRSDNPDDDNDDDGIIDGLVDDITGLQLIITTALSQFSTTRVSLPNGCHQNVMFRLTPDLKSLGNNDSTVRASTRRESEESRYKIDFDLISAAMNDDRINSRDQNNNPYLESAIATTIWNEADAINSPRRNKLQQLTAGVREPPISGPLLSCIQWTDRLRPWLTLQTLRLIREQTLPLLESLYAFQTLNHHSTPAPADTACLSTIPGLLLPFSVLHQLISSIASLEFKPVDVFIHPVPNSSVPNSSVPNPRKILDNSNGYRFPVDEEMMIEMWTILSKLKHQILRHDFTSNITRSSDMPHFDQINNVIYSLNRLSFETSENLCLFRSQFEILPRSVLMMLSFRTVTKSLDPI